MRIERGVLAFSAFIVAACAGSSSTGSVKPATASAPMTGGGSMAGMNHQMPGAGAPSARSYSKEIQAGYEIVRKATASFTNLDSLVAHGYRRDVPQCFADSIYGSGGAMGFHHVNATYFNDGKLEI